MLHFGVVPGMVSRSQNVTCDHQWLRASRSVGKCRKLLSRVEKAALSHAGRITHSPTRILVWVDNTADHHTRVGSVATLLSRIASQILDRGLGAYRWADFGGDSRNLLVAFRYHSQLGVSLQFLVENLVFVSIPISESTIYVVDPS